MPAKRKSTIIDVARVANVSKSTVSLVLQGSPLVRAQTAEKVGEVIRKLGYVYNRGAANLRRSRSNVIGMVINDLTNPFFAELAVGIESAAQSAGLVPLLAHTAECLDRQADVITTMLEQDVSGLIICPARGTEPEDLAGLARSGLPVVLAMRRLPGSRIASVVPDNKNGAAQAARHLLGLGYRRIGFLGGYGDMVVQGERKAGYETALHSAGIEPDPDLIVECDTNRAGGVAAIGELDRRDAVADAALCFNDAVALGAIHALRRGGREPGTKFGIVGFDDIAEASECLPALTTVAVEPTRLGERAAQLVLRMIEDGRIQDEQQVLGVRLVVRESCGAAAQRERGLVA